MILVINFINLQEAIGLLEQKITNKKKYSENMEVRWNLRITTTHGTKKYGRNFGVVVILRWSLSGVPLYAV